MSSNKEYFAFISYKREDEKWAKWLQHKLEHYRLPTNVRSGNPSLPQNIRPVFKDTSELGAGVLADEIHEALENSKYLIVVCSPRAVQSQWVGKEVQTFIDMGRTDKIIPFIIGGKPFSENPEEECFPSTLLNLPKERELLGVNINEMGRDAAVVKVVAHMFGLKFDTLWQRFEREQRQKRWIWIGGSVLLALLGVCIGGWFAKQNGIIERQNERLHKDSVIMANHLLKIKNDSLVLSNQKDSIMLQNALILCQSDSLKRSTEKLYKTNVLLAKERDNLKNANYRILENQARFVAKEADKLAGEGKIAKALAALYEVSPDFSKNSRPYVPEVEHSIRQLLEKEINIKKIFASNHGIAENVCLSEDNNHIFAHYLDSTMISWNVSSGEPEFIINNITSPIISNSGSYFIAKDNNGQYYVWNNKGEIISNIICSEDIKKIIFSDDDTKIIFKGENVIQIWSTFKGKMLSQLKKHIRYVFSISSDGSLASTYDEENNGIEVWDLLENKLKFCLKGHLSTIKGTHFTKDNKYIVSYADDGKIIKWDLDTGIACLYFSGPCDKIMNIEIDQKHDRILISGLNKVSYMLDFTNGNNIVEFQDIYFPTFVFGGDAVLTLDRHDKKLRLWSSIDGQNMSDFGQIRRNAPMAFNNAKRQILVTTPDLSIKLWTILDRNKSISLDQSFQDIKKVFFSKNGDYLITSSPDGIFMWTNTSMDSDKKLKAHNERINKIYSIDNNGSTVVTTASDSTVRLANLFTHKMSCLYKSKNNYKCDVQYSPVNNILSFQIDDGLYIYDTSTYNLFDSIYMERLNCHAISSNGNYIALGNLNGEIILYDIKNKTIKNICNKGNDYVSHISVSPNGNIIAANYGHSNNIWLWNSALGQPVRQLLGHSDAIIDLSFSPNGNYISSSSWDGKIILWNPINGECVHVLSGNMNRVYKASFNSNETKVISSSDDRYVCVWDSKTGKQITVLDGGLFRQYLSTFSPDDKYIITFGDYGNKCQMKIWDAHSYKLIFEKELYSFTNSLSFSANGENILLGTLDGYVHSIKLPSIYYSVTNQLKKILNNYQLTPEEKKSLYISK